jgi:hypothetical protein
LQSGTVSGQIFTETATGTALTLEFFKNNRLPMAQGGSPFRFHGRIVTTGGYDLLFDVQFSTASGSPGIMIVENHGASGGGNNLAAPTGYGIKRLGLADYRRVEQSVCCYLAGEVSHIENIMAREYKERSSKRLTRSEETVTLETSMEKETQKDSASTERYELQKEIESVISKETSAEAHASVSGGGKIRFDVGGSYAFNTSQQDSNRTAVNYSKEVTEKALERVVQKVREERTIKMIEEFEEQNRHGFDNRLGDKHVSGVYRWVDKVYKNQVFNYGKRLMYEFMVPQPASFHNAAMIALTESSNATVLEKPVDPRTAAGFYNMGNYSLATDYTVSYWASRYNAEVPSHMDDTVTISKAFDMNVGDAAGYNYTGAKSFKMELPDGYEAIGGSIGISFQFHPNADEWSHARVRVGDLMFELGGTGHEYKPITFLSPIRKELSVSAQVRDLGGLIINLSVTCRRTTEAQNKWQGECFTSIITAFEDKLAAYEKSMAAYTQPKTAKELNPGFYRQIENTVLRKNCISYLVTDAQMGQKFYQGSTTIDTTTLVTAQMDQYAAMVKFIEQAFEWDIMSYRFYPFYWGNRQEWQKNYQIDVSDPVFRSFLQSGMARVIVSVRPGFEEAAMHFMATGEIWNGGQVPAIGDDLYLSIVEELKNPVYMIDETWETRVPTTLTVLQAGSIGLVVEDGLPCECDTNNGIEKNDNKLGNQLRSLTNG